MTEQAEIFDKLRDNRDMAVVAVKRAQALAGNRDALGVFAAMGIGMEALLSSIRTATEVIEDARQQRDAARAEVAKLQEAFEKSAVYTAHLQVTRQDALAEVAKLQAEVARLRAWLPKWQRAKFGAGLWSIGVPNSDAKLEVWNYAGQWYWAFSDGLKQPATDRNAAMRAAEAAAGLPQCEVCDE